MKAVRTRWILTAERERASEDERRQRQNNKIQNRKRRMDEVENLSGNTDRAEDGAGVIEVFVLDKARGLPTPCNTAGRELRCTRWRSVVGIW
jgi:hypothetical protein